MSKSGKNGKTVTQERAPRHAVRPAVADVVQYVQHGPSGRPEPHAAIVTGHPAYDGDQMTVHLVVFSLSGFFFAHTVPHDPAGETDGTWCWPDTEQRITLPGWFTPNGVDTDQADELGRELAQLDTHTDDGQGEAQADVDSAEVRTEVELEPVAAG